MTEGQEQVLNYARRIGRPPIPRECVVAFIVALLYLPATLVTMSPGLHNDFTFLPIGVVVGLFATIVVIGCRRYLFVRAPGSGLARSAALIWLVCTAIVAMCGYSAVYGEDPHVTARRYNYCLDHLRNLGAQLEMYANDHGAKYPDSLSDLVRFDDWNTKNFICPAVVPYWTPSPSRDGLLRDLGSGRNAHHIYLGKGLTNRCPPNTILAHDNPQNWSQHGGGMSVLFANGDVRHLDQASAKKLLRALNAGQNPPPLGTLPP